LSPLGRLLRSRALPAAAALGLLLLADALFVPRFLELQARDGRLHGALVDILQRGAPLLLLALGMTPVIGLGGVDLSVGAAMAFASSLAAVLLTQTALPEGAVAALALASGLAVGLSSGGLVAFLRVQPIVATLVLMTAGRGIAQLLSGGGILAFESPGLSSLARGSFVGLPIAGLLVLSLYAATALLLRRTTLGLHVEAVGDNERAARLCGIRVGRVQLFAYGLCGALAALAGLLVAADVGAADASHVGLYLELDAILAVVVGGTPLSGGRTSFAGSLCGALAIQALSTTFLFCGLASETALCVKAAAVLLAVALRSAAVRAAEVRA
jgi:ribose/xylose/arabinose/galactoside ABC-type transport system permease subunit